MYSNQKQTTQIQLQEISLSSLTPRLTNKNWQQLKLKEKGQIKYSSYDYDPQDKLKTNQKTKLDTSIQSIILVSYLRKTPKIKPRNLTEDRIVEAHLTCKEHKGETDRIQYVLLWHWNSQWVSLNRGSVSATWSYKPTKNLTYPCPKNTETTKTKRVSWAKTKAR